MAIIDPVLLRLWGRLTALAEATPQLLRLNARQALSWPAQHAHMHDVPTLIACLEGTLRVTTACGDLDLSPGMALAVAPGAWHRHAALRRGSAWYGQGVVGDRSDVGLADHEQRGVHLNIPGEPSASLLSVLASAATIERRRQAWRDLLREVLTNPDGRSTTYDPSVASMHGALWRGLGRPLRAAAVLAAAGCSRRQAHRRFTAWFGETPKQGILRRKLVLARQLLDEGASISEAAAGAGFRRRADLTRAWRLAFGSPPSQRD